MYGQPPSLLYPKIGGGSSTPIARNPPYQPEPAAPTTSGTGIRVSIKTEYRIKPPPQLLPQGGEIPRSIFQFDFEFEKIVLAEAVKENTNWSRLGIGNLHAAAAPPPRATQSHSNYGHTADPMVNKYIAAGLSREAVSVAVAHFGDNPTKVKEFTEGYMLLREMGFSSNNVAEALLMYDNDTDKALAHFLNSTS